MKLVESADGTIRVIELDPTKQHIVIADFDSGLQPGTVHLVDGALWLIRPGARVQIIEGETLPEKILMKKEVA